MKKQDTKTSPPVKVVGFRVEGATPSPRDSSLADAAAGNTVTGSPSPVIIPPAFSGHGRTMGGDGTPTMRPSANSPTSISIGGPFQLDMSEEGSASGGLPPIRTEVHGLDPDVFARDRTPTKGPGVASPPGGVCTLPLTPVGTSTPADQIAAAEAADSPRMLQLGMPSMPEQVAVAAAPAAPAAAAAPVPSNTSPKHPQQVVQLQPPLAAPVTVAAGEGVARGLPAAGEGKKPLKEMTKAERRMVQEAQRAAKAAAKAGQGGGGSTAVAKEQGKGLSRQGSTSNLGRQGAASRQPSSAQQEPAKAAAEEQAGRAIRQQQQQQGGQKGGSSARASGGTPEGSSGLRAKSAEMFAHLPQPRGITLQSVAAQKGPLVPLAAVKLGLLFADGSVRGANARCIAMLQMFVQCIQDFRTPSGREFAKEFSPALNNIINFLVACRPLSVSMGNAIKAVKGCLEKMKLQPPPSEQQAKDQLVEEISDYLEQKIRFADRMLVKHAIDKIQDGDTIMTYAYSTVVAATLLAAHKAGKRFDVVVVDSRPLLEGRRMLTTLLEAGVTCEYCHLTALSYEITEVDKVFLGAASVLSNGTVLSRVGTAAVALMAAAQRVPVLVCCETYKFHERVQLDSITHNELMDKGGLAHVQDRPDVPDMKGWQENGKVHLLNLAYDLMPADFVTMVVSEMGAVPPTSVAVILREAQRDLGML